MNTLQPSFNGLVQDESDGVNLPEACLDRRTGHAGRLPRESRTHSGNTSIYREKEGLNHWDDGKLWMRVSEQDGIIEDREDSVGIPLRRDHFH